MFKKACLGLSLLATVALLSSGPAIAGSVEETQVRTSKGTVTVYRGSALVQGPGVDEATVRHSTSSQKHIVAGRTLWVLDEEAQKVRACRLVNTFYVSKKTLRCASRSF